MHFINCQIRVTFLPQSPNFTFIKGKKKVYREKKSPEKGLTTTAKKLPKVFFYALEQT